jgi:cysteine rich repeat protein
MAWCSFHKVEDNPMLKGILVTGIALALLSSNAIAKEKSSALACAVDIKSKCGEAKPGEGRIRTCVKEHMSEFSEPCQAKLANLAAVSQACAADVKKACGDVKPRRGRIVACLKSALGNLSDACKDGVAEAVSAAR